MIEAVGTQKRIPLGLGTETGGRRQGAQMRDLSKSLATSR